MQAQEGNIYFTELAERVEYGNYAHGVCGAEEAAWHSDAVFRSLRNSEKYIVYNSNRILCIVYNSNSTLYIVYNSNRILYIIYSSNSILYIINNSNKPGVGHSYPSV